MNEIEKIVSKHGGKLAGADKALRRKLRSLVRSVVQESWDIAGAPDQECFEKYKKDFKERFGVQFK